MSIYLDHAATTQPIPESIQSLVEHLRSCYGNPASIHAEGRRAEQILRESRQRIAKTLGCRQDELFFTSCGSESINLAIKGVLWHRSKTRGRLVISAGEHAATRETASWMAYQGYVVDVLPLTPQGTVSLDALEKALKEPATLISLIHVNNETGAVNPIEEITARRDRYQPEARLHFDTIQSWGKLPLSFKQSKADLLSGSGHKCGAPKGIGWLIKKQNLILDPLIHGGGQQNRLRSGTENPPLAAALAVSLEKSMTAVQQQTERIRHLRKLFIETLIERSIPFRQHSPESGVPHILSISFSGLQGETLTHALSAESIYISTGSACGARKKKGNAVLSAMQIDAESILNSVRISFAADLTDQEIILAAETLAKLHQRLAR